MNRLNMLSEINIHTVPKILFLQKKVFKLKNYLLINYPIKIIGAGQGQTIIQNGGIHIQGTKETNEKGKNNEKVELSEMTIRDAKSSGLYNNNGLSFLCDRMTFTRCSDSGVLVMNATGRLRNCMITQCADSGLVCIRKAFVEVEGSHTRIDGNVKNGGRSFYGLVCDSSSSIHLLLPLKKKVVATNNGGGGNYVKKWGMFWRGKILEVGAFGQ